MEGDVRCKLFCHRVCRSFCVMMLLFGVINALNGRMIEKRRQLILSVQQQRQQIVTDDMKRFDEFPTAAERGGSLLNSYLLRF